MIKNSTYWDTRQGKRDLFKPDGVVAKRKAAAEINRTQKPTVKPPRAKQLSIEEFIKEDSETL